VAMRAALMAKKTDMRLLGVIENMTSDVFGSGGGARLAEEIGAELLGTVPLDPALREAGDAGEPLVWADPDAPASRAIVGIAEAILATERERGIGIVKELPLVG
jgi:ATP-binding protein involved in chromosome partitioning